LILSEKQRQYEDIGTDLYTQARILQIQNGIQNPSPCSKTVDPLLDRYGAHLPAPLQLISDAHPVCVAQSPGATHAHETAAIALFGAASEATIGKATIDARPIFLIS
jgi:hypothetical protein